MCLIVLSKLVDVVNTTVTSLTTLSKGQRRPAWGSIFLLNNIAYLLEHLVNSPRNPEVTTILSKPSIDILNSNYRTAKAGYFDLNFTPLMQALADDPKEPRGVITRGTSTKDKFTRFFDLLDEVTERHRIARVLEDDPEAREQIADDVVKLVVPSLQRFTQKHKDKSTCRHFLYMPPSPHFIVSFQTHRNVIYLPSSSVSVSHRSF